MQTAAGSRAARGSGSGLTCVGTGDGVGVAGCGVGIGTGVEGWGGPAQASMARAERAAVRMRGMWFVMLVNDRRLRLTTVDSRPRFHEGKLFAGMTAGLRG